VPFLGAGIGIVFNGEEVLEPGFMPFDLQPINQMSFFRHLLTVMPAIPLPANIGELGKRGRVRVTAAFQTIDTGLHNGLGQILHFLPPQLRRLVAILVKQALAKYLA
jgi:hypothetical protein